MKRRPNTTASELLTMLLLLLLTLHLSPCFVEVLARKAACPPSSCGQLRDIPSPLRFKGDPEGCGSPHFELDCEGNRAVLHFLSGKYYVTNASEYYSGTSVSVVDAGIANDACGLPSQSLSPGLFWDDESYGLEFCGDDWAVFVNCSRMIKNTMYHPVACMSAGSTYVYLVHGDLAYQLRFLQPPCRVLYSIPLRRDAKVALASSGADVMEALRMGFKLYLWPPTALSKPLTASIVGRCFIDSFPFFIPSSASEALQIVLFPIAFAAPFNYCLERHLDLRYRVVLTALVGALSLVTEMMLVNRIIVGPLTILVLLLKKLQEAHASIDTVEKFLQNQRMLMPARYSYPEIISITSHFQKKLGQGGFGSVFQGKLPGDHLVAVKLLNDSKCNGEDFINEVSTLGQIHHVNILRLIGFCSEGDKRALIYEYMPNGSLDRHILHPQGMDSSLDWKKLQDIALGIAHGIEYLHTGCDMCILHFDIKPQNILLDRNFTPKVSDFGLARLYPKGFSLVSVSAARGTIGYIAPELMSRNFGAISYKSDVYSFGMLLLDMAGARKDMNAMREKSSEVYFPTWIYDRLNEGRVLEEDIVIEIGDIERKLCLVGLWCIQMRPSDRPSISKVIEMLEGSTDTLQMPPKPFFSSLPISVVESCLDPLVEDLSEISEVSEV